MWAKKHSRMRLLITADDPVHSILPCVRVNCLLVQVHPMLRPSLTDMYRDSHPKLGLCLFAQSKTAVRTLTGARLDGRTENVQSTW